METCFTLPHPPPLLFLSPPPSQNKVSFNLLKTIFYQHLLFSVAVGVFLRYIMTRFVENWLLWARDMTSYVTCGQAIWNKNV